MVHNLYALLRYHTDSLKADRNQLENAPLTARKRKELENAIAYHQRESREIRARLKDINRNK